MLQLVRDPGISKESLSDSGSDVEVLPGVRASAGAQLKAMPPYVGFGARHRRGDSGQRGRQQGAGADTSRGVAYFVSRPNFRADKRSEEVALFRHGLIADLARTEPGTKTLM